MPKNAFETFVEMSQLKKYATALSEESDKIRSDTVLLKNLLEEMNHCWSGNAQKSFSESFLEAISCIEPVADSFCKTAEDFCYAVDLYERCEADAVQAIGMVKF